MGLAMGIGGIVMAAAGIPLIVIGAKRVPNDDPTAVRRLTPQTRSTTIVATPHGFALLGTF